MRNVLIVGATRGLGKALGHRYAKEGKNVYATARYNAPQDNTPGIHWIPNIDISREDAARLIAMNWEDGSSHIDLLVISAGLFATETLEDVDIHKEIEMYKTCAIGPPILISNLLKLGLLKNNSRIVLVGGESGSITLRHEVGGGGNYGGHGSKAALNMVGKLLSIDLKPKGIAVAIVHTGYLRKQLPDGSFEHISSKKNAVKPEEAAHALHDWIRTFGMSKTGQFWSVRGPAGIKTADAVLGKVENLLTPLELPW